MLDGMKERRLCKRISSATEDLRTIHQRVLTLVQYCSTQLESCRMEEQINSEIQVALSAAAPLLDEIESCAQAIGSGGELDDLHAVLVESSPSCPSQEVSRSNYGGDENVDDFSLRGRRSPLGDVAGGSVQLPKGASRHHRMHQHESKEDNILTYVAPRTLRESSAEAGISPYRRLSHSLLPNCLSAVRSEDDTPKRATLADFSTDDGPTDNIPMAPLSTPVAVSTFFAPDCVSAARARANTSGAPRHSALTDLRGPEFHSEAEKAIPTLSEVLQWSSTKNRGSLSAPRTAYR